MDDLTESIQATRQALDILPESDQDYIRHTKNLAYQLAEKFDYTESMSDLNESIKAF
jgi:hypothetical protein